MVPTAHLTWRTISQLIKNNLLRRNYFIVLDDEIFLRISVEEVFFDKVAVLPRAAFSLEVYLEPRLILGGSHVRGSRVVIFNFPSLPLELSRKLVRG
jgi:hypothetical protein